MKLFYKSKKILFCKIENNVKRFCKSFSFSTTPPYQVREYKRQN